MESGKRPRFLKKTLYFSKTYVRFSGFYGAGTPPAIYGSSAKKTAQTNPTYPTLGDSKMALMIKDLATSRELDGKAMSGVRGGTAIAANLGNTINANQNVTGGKGPTSVVGPTNVINQTATAVDLSQLVTINGFPKAPKSYGDSWDYGSSGYGSSPSYGYDA
jgi:hypothetical protein